MFFHQTLYFNTKYCTIFLYYIYALKTIYWFDIRRATLSINVIHKAITADFICYDSLIPTLLLICFILNVGIYLKLVSIHFLVTNWKPNQSTIGRIGSTLFSSTLQKYSF